MKKKEYFSADVTGRINCYTKTNQACSKKPEHQITSDVSGLLQRYIKRIKAFAWTEYSGHNSQLNTATRS